MNRQLLVGIAVITLGSTIVSNAKAQPTNTTATTTSQPVANLTNIFKADKQLQFCLTPNEIASSPFPTELTKNPCSSKVDILYQSAHTLGLSSLYGDLIWKGINIAKQYGYKVDGITSYVTRSSTDSSGSVNILVSMSR